MNWVQIKGDGSIFFEGETIKYIPAQITVNETIDQEKPDKRLENKEATQIRSSEYFENGTIEFNFIFAQRESLLTITIGEYLFVGLNSKFSSSQYSIRKWSSEGKKMDVLSESGVKGLIETQKQHSFKIEIFGSTIIFYIDGVEVCRALTKITKSQPTLSFSSIDKEIIVTHFKIRTDKPKAFVVMQFSDDYNNLYKDVIKPICSDRFGYDCVRGDDFFSGASIILNDITNSIKESSIIIAEITPDNPNVFYEVGFAHALNKPTILLSDKKRQQLPFDVSGFRTIFYDNTIGGKKIVEEMLIKHLENIQQK